MAYTLNYSGGTITINDGTLNANTSLSLPGRNYAGYGSPVDQNFVSMLENFASAASGPTNAIKGQVWFSSTDSSLKYNISPTLNSPTWVTLLAAGSNANLGNVVANNGVFNNLQVLYTANINDLLTDNISTGGPTIPGTITGNWTLTAGSRIQATYADLAERFESDLAYEAGTVVELGGDKEITAVKDDLSDRVFGVISSTAAYLMNSGAGNDSTHPPVAMTGRVEVKVVGKINKGDRLVSAGQGRARAARLDETTSFNIVGRSLEDKTSDGEGRVLSAVSARL